MSINIIETQRKPSADFPFFMFEPNDGMVFFRTAEDRDSAMRDAIKEYCEDEWNLEVTGIYGGEVSHHVVARNVEHAPHPDAYESDEAYEEAREDWMYGDIELVCSYEPAHLSDPGEALE